MAGWHFAPGYAPRTTAGRLLAGAAGRRGALPGNWSMPKQALVALLNQAKARWGAHHR